jgi:hypothetical protein
VSSVVVVEIVLIIVHVGRRMQDNERTFCHRHILVEYFEEVCTMHGIGFHYCGEIR